MQHSQLPAGQEPGLISTAAATALSLHQSKEFITNLWIRDNVHSQD